MNTRPLGVANALFLQLLCTSARGAKVGKLGPGVYKVSPPEGLTEGEYGSNNGACAGPTGGTKICDFDIKFAR